MKANNTQLIKQKAQELLAAINASPGTITLGNHVIEKDIRFKKDLAKNKLLLRQMVQNQWNKKYH
ncbi:hypothetical protein [Limnovirga soli]|uniref:Uncharacterized protein n=1 Tax=Limnovirga soli TaxID=2656915 RepID=A0A8J8FIV5_9BACT|nr:hypothetical protein [Limnovirga soli]NNV55884.1 hypothetical protein [Limnovirga soli]